MLKDPQMLYKSVNQFLPSLSVVLELGCVEVENESQDQTASRSATLYKENENKEKAESPGMKMWIFPIPAG